MKILVTTTQRASGNVTAPIAEKLVKNGHDVTIYCTGNEQEAAVFSDFRLPYARISPKGGDFDSLVRDYDVVISGLSGSGTGEGYFIRAANKQNIRVIGVADQNSHWRENFGNVGDLPSIIAVMDKDCIDGMDKELDVEVAEEAVKRARIIGWTAYDHFPAIAENFTADKRRALLKSLTEHGIKPGQELHFLPTQNIHPDSKYMKDRPTRPKKQEFFDYELGLTDAICREAAKLGLKLVLKPHPGEEFERNFTRELAEEQGHIYLPWKACKTQDLILASNSVNAGRSTCLLEAVIFDKKTAGYFPGLDEGELKPFPAAKLRAIPLARTFELIPVVLERVTSNSAKVNQSLALKRARFRTLFGADGKASERAVELIEKQLRI